jgi:hypothetical protein
MPKFQVPTIKISGSSDENVDLPPNLLAQLNWNVRRLTKYLKYSPICELKAKLRIEPDKYLNVTALNFPFI